MYLNDDIYRKEIGFRDSSWWVVHPDQKMKELYDAHEQHLKAKRMEEKRAEMEEERRRYHIVRYEIGRSPDRIIRHLHAALDNFEELTRRRSHSQENLAAPQQPSLDIEDHDMTVPVVMHENSQGVVFDEDFA
jgi:hypothetical protein